MIALLSDLLPAQVVTDILFGLSMLITICAGVDAVFPQPSAGSLWVIPRKICSLIALNFANAKNAIEVGLPPAFKAIVTETGVIMASAPAVIATFAPTATSATVNTTSAAPATTGATPPGA